MHGERVFEDRDVEFVVGEGAEHGVIDGVDTALLKFKKGEKSLLKIAPKYAYGSEGNADLNIPAGTALKYEVELKQFEKVSNTLYVVHIAVVLLT